MGPTGYYIPDYASIAVPLINLTRRSSPNLVKWDSDCNKVFKKLKELLCRFIESLYSRLTFKA